MRSGGGAIAGTDVETTPRQRPQLHLATPRHDPYRLDLYGEWMRSWDAAPATIEKRLQFGAVLAGRYPDPARVTATELQRFLADPAFSPWTRSTYFTHMRSLFKWLDEVGEVPVDPTARMRRPRTPAAKPRPLSPAEAADLLKATADDHRATTWLLLGMLAGLRVHEVAKIRGEDVTEQSIYVLGKGRKSATIPTHALVWAIAQQHPRTGYWFPSRQGDRDHLHPMTISKHITGLFRELGIEGSYHRCRHTFGTTLLRSGANLRVVQDLMRHASLATTAHYLGVDEDELQAAVANLHGDADSTKRPLLTFASRIDGHDAQVRVYSDRVEWSRDGAGAPGGQTKALRIESLSSVTTRAGGLTGCALSLVASRDTIEIPVPRAEAEQIRTTLTNLMANPPAAAPRTEPAAARVPDPMEQLRRLGELHVAQVVTDAEFDAKKAELLDRI